jgi:hypothetical protein
MGKYLDRWREYPTKHGPMTCQEIGKLYRVAKKTANDIEMKKVLHYQPWKIKAMREGRSFEFYWVSTRITPTVRDFIADNWRDCGYDVAIRKDAIYVRRK